MKEKQFACFILGMAIFACFFGIMKMQTKLQDARKAADTAKTDAENTSRQRMVAASNFADLEKKSKAEVAYYQAWRPHFEGFREGTGVYDKVAALMKKDNIEPYRQDIAAVGYKDKFGVISQIQRVNLVLVDEYVKLFSFLAFLEGDLKTARVTSLAVQKSTGESEHIQMEVTVDVPVLAVTEGEGADSAS